MRCLEEIRTCLNRYESSQGIKKDLGAAETAAEIGCIALCYVEISKLVNGRGILEVLQGSLSGTDFVIAGSFSMVERDGEVEKKFYSNLDVFLLETVCLLCRGA